MSTEGWVCFYRKMEEWEWYKVPHMLHLFFHLIVKANHKDGKWQGIQVNRGQLVTGRKSLSGATGISEQTVRTCLVRLEKTGEITQKSTNKYSVITICKYDDYQKGTTPVNQQLTNNQPATNQQLTTNNNVNNETKVNIVEKPTRQNIPFLEIVSYLNEKTGKNYKPTTNATKAHIKARWNEGFTLSDFKKVIETKSREWSSDPKMLQYLRPQTIFGTNFEAYLNNSKQTDEYGRPI
jgi:uncharacterized phage protein (TIGR02220 family)